jgi:peroxiredoxin
MAEDETGPGPGKGKGQQLLLLGVAALVAVGIGIWLIAFSGGGDEAVRAAGDGAAQVGLIDDFRPEVGKPAPDFALLDARDGTTVRKLSDYRGQVVVLNWYATWCGPCRNEIPDFQEAYTALEGKVVFLGVNLQESRTKAVGLLDELGATYPALLDSDGAIAEWYRVTGMPTTYFIDREGIVRSFGSGMVTEEALREELAQFGLTYVGGEES